MTLLREENERQKIIINALAEKLRQIETLVYSNAEIKDGVNSRNLSIEEKMEGVKSFLYSYAKNKDGVNIDNLYTAKKMDGVNTNNPYSAEKKDGVKSDNLPIAENKAGVNSNNLAIAEKKAGEKYLNQHMVVSALRHVMLKCSNWSIYSTAKILIQLHNSPRNSYKHLRELTGLSEDGMTKRIMAMKKRGLIVRTAFQQYTITGKGLEVLDKSWAER